MIVKEKFQDIAKIPKCSKNSKIVVKIPDSGNSGHSQSIVRFYCKCIQVDYGFTFDAQGVWNELSEELQAAFFIASLRKELSHTSFSKDILQSLFINHLLGAPVAQW